MTFLMYKLVEELIILGITALLMCTWGAGVFLLVVLGDCAECGGRIQ